MYIWAGVEHELERGVYFSSWFQGFQSMIDYLASGLGPMTA